MIPAISGVGLAVHLPGSAGAQARHGLSWVSLV